MKKLARLLTFFVGIWLHFAASAQTYFNKKETLHSGAVSLYSVLERNEKYYTAGVCVDSSRHLGGGWFLNVISLRLSVWDKNGNVIRDTFYERPDLGVNEARSNCLTALTDGTFLLAGDGADTSGHAKLFLFCFDSNAHMLWQKEWDKPANFPMRPNNDVWALKDFKSDGAGHWLMLSTIYRRPVTGLPGYQKMLLTKLDSGFNIIWNKDFGDDYYDSEAGRLLVEPDGYVLGGGYCNWNRVVTGFKCQAEIFKTDTAGNQTWHWLSNYKRLTFPIADIMRTADGGFVYSGQGAGYEERFTSFSSTLWWRSWVEKIDANGNPLWSATLNDSLMYTGTLNLQKVLYGLPDSSILVAGQVVAKWNSIDTYATRSYGALTRIDKNGVVKWQRKYVANMDSLRHFINDMKRTADGGYVLAGYSDDVYSGSLNRVKAWLLKIDSNGCQSTNDPQCWPLAVSSQPGNQSSSYEVYPNPVSGLLLVKFNKVSERDQVLILTDISGRVVRQSVLQGRAGKVVIDMDGLERGMYIYRILEVGVVITSGKVIKL